MLQRIEDKRDVKGDGQEIEGELRHEKYRREERLESDSEDCSLLPQDWRFCEPTLVGLCRTIPRPDTVITSTRP